MRRILMTGIGGFVGRHAATAFARHFGETGELLGVGRRPDFDPPAGCTYRQLDLGDARSVTSLIAAFRPTDVLHLAAHASVQQAEGDRSSAWRSNVGHLITLAQALAEQAPGARFFFASTGEIYGRSFLDHDLANERTPPQPANTYARTKLVGETVVSDILHGGGHQVVLLRPFNHIGAGQDERFVVSSFAAQIARIEAGLTPPVLEVGDLNARRDFLDVRDAVAAYVTLVARADELPRLSLFNVASGHPRPIASILDELREMSRRPFEVIVSPERLRPSQIPVASGDASALTVATGWTPTISWDETLASILNDARARVGSPSFVNAPRG